MNLSDWRLGTLLVGLCVLLSGPSFPASAADLTVNNVSDLVNGDVTSPQALMARPGADGISLREAIQAVNNGPGPHAIGIAGELIGHTIALTSPLRVTRDGVTLTGLAGPDDEPAITLDGRGITAPTCCRALLFISASDFTITHFKFTGVTEHGIRIQAGENVFPPSAPPKVSNIRVEHNLFDNSGVASGSFPFAIRVGTDPEGIAVDATIANVRIAHNAFRHYSDSGIIVNANGTNCTIQDLVIQANSFDRIPYPVELASATGANNRIVGSRIIGNTFANGVNPVFIGHLGRERPPQATDNEIEDTLVEGNVFRGDYGSVAISGGQSDGNYVSAMRNVVRHTQIVNNLMVTGGGIVITGGGAGGSLNRVEGVQIVNNTIVTHPQAGLRVNSNQDLDSRRTERGTANTVVGVAVLNTIFRPRLPSVPRADDEISGELRPDQVRFSITTASAFAGNGNIAVDPRFTDPDRGDFRLQLESPAIDAGNSEAAPERDLDGRRRIDEPSAPNRGSGQQPHHDIGAFEFAGRPAAYFTVVNFSQDLGRVTSNPPGIDCGRLCWAAFDVGAELTLTPVPGLGAVFSHWTGDPDCGLKTIRVSGPQTCTAVFVRR